ncbi:hypothetical protein QE152_g20786 [Popillia japonica]|uniref:Uncharacterized protein n=1 Tax=Popillia japonica TaxID=7064 RepID=A0AAW1KPA7_POPJA
MNSNYNLNFSSSVQAESKSVDEKEGDPFRRRESIKRTPPTKSRNDGQGASCCGDSKNKQMISKKEGVCTEVQSPQVDMGKKWLRSVERGTSITSDTENKNLSDGEDSVWIDEEMSASPIYQLYENQGNDGHKYAPSYMKIREMMGTSGTDREPRKEMREVQAFMMKLNEKTEELRKHVKESTKTKTEIKAVTRELVNIVGNLGRKIDVLKAHYTAITEKADSYEEQIARTLQEPERPLPPQCNSVGVQAEEREIVNEISQKKMRSPNITTGGQGTEEIKTSFPEVMALLEEKLEEGVIEYVKTRTETIMRRGSKGEISRMLYMLPYEIDPNGVNDFSRLHDILHKLKNMMLDHGTERVKLIALENIDKDYLRKCAEYVLRGTVYKIQLVCPGKYR